MFKRGFELSKEWADDHDCIACGLHRLIDGRYECQVGQLAEEVLLAWGKSVWPQAEMKPGGYSKTGSLVTGSDELHDERLILAPRDVGHAVRVT